VARQYFNDFQDSDDPITIDALEGWLNNPIVNTQQDLITYWTGMQSAGHPLAAMALDFISVPGKSYMSTLSCIDFLSSKLYQCRMSIFKRWPHNLEISAFIIR
jgi:hypothetical protein